MRLVAAPAPARPLEVLNEVWKVVGKFTDPVAYMNVAQTWIEYPLQHLTVRWRYYICVCVLSYDPACRCVRSALCWAIF